jgi:hypothetical protein
MKNKIYELSVLGVLINMFVICSGLGMEAQHTRKIHFPFVEQGIRGEAKLRTNIVGGPNSLRIVTLNNRNDEYLLLIIALQPFFGSH